MRRPALVVAASASGVAYTVVDPLGRVLGPIVEADPVEDDWLTTIAAQAHRQALRSEEAVATLVVATDGSREADWQALSERCALPLTMVSLPRAALKGEILCGAAAARTSAVLFDADALQIGLLLNGNAYDGASSRAGDLSHLGVDRTGSRTCLCGRTGCLGVLVAAGDEASAPPLPFGSRPMPSKPLGWIAVACITLLNTINPEVLILKGRAFGRAAEFEWLAETVRMGCLAQTRAGLDAVVRAHTEAVFVGAAALADGLRTQSSDRKDL